MSAAWVWLKEHAKQVLIVIVSLVTLGVGWAIWRALTRRKIDDAIREGDKATGAAEALRKVADAAAQDAQKQMATADQAAQEAAKAKAETQAADARIDARKAVDATTRLPSTADEIEADARRGS